MAKVIQKHQESGTLKYAIIKLLKILSFQED